jgi:hypothetical protein
MQGDMTNNTNQQSSRSETENASGAASNVNEKAVTARNERAGHFRTWWREYQRKMKSALRSGPMKLQCKRKRVVRYHRRLLYKAFPEESAPISAISIVSNRTGPLRYG